MSWPKGKPRSPESKEKIRISMLPHSSEVAERNRNRIITQEQRDKMSINRRGEGNVRWKGGGKQFTCPVCGKFFYGERPSRKRTYCSRRCSTTGILHNYSGFSRGKGGKRVDIGNIYFRSSYEANYARYLNFLITNSELIRWEYEPDTFEFAKIKRGTRQYTPDFKVYLNNGHIEYHEVKGWDYPKGITARKRFAKYFPHLKLIVIDRDFFRALNKQGILSLIPNWEAG